MSALKIRRGPVDHRVPQYRYSGRFILRLSSRRWFDSAPGTIKNRPVPALAMRSTTVAGHCNGWASLGREATLLPESPRATVASIAQECLEVLEKSGALGMGQEMDQALSRLDCFAGAEGVCCPEIMIVPTADRSPMTGSNAFRRPPRRARSGGPASQDPALLRRLLRAKDRMDVTSHEDWPVWRLAHVSGVSAAHFARSFKRAFGVPPHRYLLARRIERATALLRDTDLSITDVAFKAGWASLGTFGRTLRDVTGQTPGAIRSRARATARGLGRVPACFLSAAQRPDLTMAVSEKRRRIAGGIKGLGEQEVR